MKTVKIGTVFFLIAIFLLPFCTVKSQNKKMLFKSLNPQNKIWAVTHIVQIKKALHVSEQVLNTMDSLYAERIFATNTEGGHLDAFRHIYWMYSLSSEIGVENARRIGIIYEDYNRYVFDNQYNSSYDKAGRLMDEYNNEVGLYLYSKIGSKDKSIVLENIKNLIINGYAKIISKDKLLRSLDRNNEIIPDSLWKGKWENERCLINSNTGT